MSEPKRVSFTSISTSASMTFGGGTNTSSLMVAPNCINITSSAANLRFGNDFLVSGQDKANLPAPAGNERKNAANSSNKTVRLQLELFQTDSSSYPEFNYSKLLHLEKKKIKKLKQKSNGFSDPFEENDDDVARIAQELEKKYGSAYASGRRRNKKDDHCDIGLGYDESDSFIDNTEAYDEIMPEEVETIEGGFYINCGALEFKQLHTEAIKTKTDEIIKMPNRPRKRMLSTSSEESSSSSDDENSDDDDDDEEDDSGDETVVETASSKSKNSAEKGQKIHSKKSAQEIDAKKQKSKTIAISCSSSNSPKPSPSCNEIGSDSEKERNRQKTVKTTTVKDMLKAKRDNFLKMQGGDVKQPVNGELKGAASKSSDEDTSSDEDSDDSSGNSDSKSSVAPVGKLNNKKPANSEEGTEKLRSGDTTLPELEADIIASIHGFKELVKTKNMTGKKFQFDDTLTDVFLKIDESLLCVEKTQRNMVFAHLEFHLSLPKYYFLRKAKQLRIKEEKMKSKRALGKLRKAVIELMPVVIANYGVELKKHAEAQDTLNSDHPPKMPKKKFTWNTNLRNLLYDVYQVRWTSFPVLGTRKETLEEFINGYLRDKVVELWPNGWMRYEELQKEIERRKAAAKKAKEKKKDSSNVATANPTAAANPAAPSTLVGAQVASSAAATMPATNTYMKQFEEFASSSRSCANSDTESVASSSTSNGVKRKGGEKSKKYSKMQKTNGEHQLPLGGQTDHATNKTQYQQQQQLSAAGLDLISPTKRTDHSIHSIISAALPALPPGMVGNAANALVQSAISNASSCGSQPSKHSKSSAGDANVAVIDVDNYRSASAILQTSKQYLSAGGKVVSSEIPAKITKRGSSSESDGVEIVGVFPSKPSAAASKVKAKKNSNQASRSETPISGSYAMDSAASTLYATAIAKTTQNPGGSSNNNSTNSNNNNNNSKKSSTNAKDFDVNQFCKLLKELEDSTQLHPQQQKITLTTTTQNTSSKNSSNQ